MRQELPGGAQRLHRAARRRAPGRICAAAGRAAGLADRLHRLGRRGHRAGRAGRALRRRPLYPAGAGADRRRLLRDPPPGRAAAGELAGRRAFRRRRLGFDPWLHTVDGVARLEAALQPIGAKAVACADNPLDAVWKAQPPAPLSPICPQEKHFTGRDSPTSGRRSGPPWPPRCLGAAVLTQPDSLAWLLNIRGGDVPHTPLPLGFAIDRPRRQGRAVRRPPQARRRGSSAISATASPRPRPSGFGAGARPRCGKDGRRAARSGDQRRPVDRRPAGCGRRASSAADDPCAPAQGPQERGRDRRHHAQRIGATAPREPLPRLARPRPRPGRLDELERSTGWRACRRDGALFRDLSFDTISGAGPNGAIVHYRVDAGDQPAARARASSISSIPAPNTSTAPPTSPAPWRSARRPPRCATASPGC